jgi:alpha-glucosidase
VTDSYEAPRALIGETPVKIDELMRYYGDGFDELHLAFNFPFITSPLEAVAMRDIVESTEATLPPDAWPAWTGSNHDMSRLASRWAGGDERKTRLALLMLLCLRGTPVLYQGDEIGLVDSPVSREDLRDPLGVRYWPAYVGRDAMRTPMPWRHGPGGGFTDPEVRPWLPLEGASECNVAQQRTDPASVLSMTRDIIALRRTTADLRTGGYRTMAGPSGVWAWRRGETVVVVLNMNDHDTTFEGVKGEIRVGTDRGRQGELVDQRLMLRAWEGVVTEAP